jgi:hypothetical protein
MDGAKPAKSPCSSGSKLSRYDGTPLDDPSIYQHVVRSLQYCTLTRLDISFSVNQLCQHLHSPTDIHLSTAKRVLRYLKVSIDHDKWYSKGSLQLNAFCDSDWAGDPYDRRFTSDFAVFLGSCLISWSAKKQPVVSRSSTKAEYRSLATTELYWLRMLFKDLHVSLQLEPILWCDNVNARFLTLKSKLLVVAPPINLRGDVNLCPIPSVNSTCADNDPPDKVQPLKRFNAVATLSCSNAATLSR